MRREHLILAAIILILAVPPGIAVAQTLDTHSATAGVNYVTNSDVQVTLGDGREVAAQPFVDDQTWSTDNVSVSGTDASVRVTDATFTGDTMDIEAVDATGSVTVTRTDLGRSFTVEDGDANLIEVGAINATDGETDFSYQSDNGVTVRVDGVLNASLAAVDANTGEPIAGADATDTGSATFELPSGQRDIRIETAPAELEVRNELKPNELIDGNVTLRARLFSQNDTVIEREVTNGTVSLAGFALDEPLVVTVKAENDEFVYRRILLESAIQSSEIYLLPTDTNETASEVRFDVRDDTGRFDSANTRFYVEKPITRDYDGDGTNETRYQIISGDRIGASSEFPTILVDSERYRLRVENNKGEQRVLGSYTVQGPSIEPIPIGSVEFSTDVDEGAAFQATLREAPEGASHNHEVRLVFVDPEGETSQIEVGIANESGGAIRPTSTEQINSTAAYVETFPITDDSWTPEDNTAIVSVTAQRGFDTQQFEQPLGDVPEFPLGPLPEQLVTLAGVVSILAVLGLLVIANPPLAALVTPGYAGILVLLGIVPIPMPAVVLAGVVGVLAALGSRR
jgi:hypothetical protein